MKLKVLAGFTCVLLSLVGTHFSAQTTEGQAGVPPAASQAAAPSKQAPVKSGGSKVVAPARGQVLFQSHGQPPEPDADRQPLLPAQAGTEAAAKASGPEITDADRAALTPTAYDLDVRLDPATAHLAMRAEVTLRNDGATPLRRIALQISSTLRWESVTLLSEETVGSTPVRRATLPLAQHLLDTDADHTGKADEAILALPAPLGPGKTVMLDTFYSGTIAQSGARLERIGATADQALAADWDAITPDATALRGFGNVLWYPVAAPQLFLGDGAKLFQAIGQMRLQEETATVRLHVAVEYRGDPPTAVYFCGRRQKLTALSDDPDAPVAAGSGIATAEFTAAPLGFRAPDLFVVELPEAAIAPLPESSGQAAEPGAASSSSSGNSSQASTSGTPAPASVGDAASGGAPMLAVESTDDASLPSLAASAERVAPLLQEWLGPRPLRALTVIDHSGQPYEDGALLVAPVGSLAAASSAPDLAHGLTHAWVDTGQPWMDEGLSEFMTLLWTERESGREAAQAQLAALLPPLTLVEPDFGTAAKAAAALASANPPGQALSSASDEVYYRRKAAAVWWMLRGIVGDAPLRLALEAWRTQPAVVGDGAAQAVRFERLLEKTSGKDLGWFFHDWVLHDLGLPDLSIVDVTPRQLPAGPGHSSGWLVAVTVHNDGAAEAEVPLIVRSGTFSITRRLRVPGFGNATERVLTETPPDQVVVNDGEVPEVRSSTHTVHVVLHRE